MTDASILKRLDAIDEYARRISDIMLKRMEVFFEDANDEEIAQIFQSSSRKTRVKPPESVLRKAKELGISQINQIPESIEDYIGTRISTPNKAQARKLFDFLRKTCSEKRPWFCSVIEFPKFVPMTVEDRNSYSISTGYQAYHVTYVYDSGEKYKSDCEVCRWPFELQIMSQLWEFWADYSRKYFYRTSSAKQAVPYQVAISRILDSADDLMRVTRESVLGEEPIYDAAQADQTAIVERISLWLSSNDRLTKLFHAPNLPAPVFLLKINDLCESMSLELDDLESFMKNPGLVARYNAILAASYGVRFLPPYQCVLAYALLGKGKTNEEVVSLVNEQLWLLGKKLRIPPSGGRKSGKIVWFDPLRFFGIVESEGNTYKFLVDSFETDVDPYVLADKSGAEVTLELVLEESEQYGFNFIARRMQFA